MKRTSRAPARRSGRAEPRLPSGVGAIVMALGIFCIGALTRLPYGAIMMKPMAAAVVAVWCVTALALLRSLAQDGVRARTVPPVESFAIGTWVAGTAVAAQVMTEAFPDGRQAALALFLASAALWLWFFPRAVAKLARLCVARVRPNGVILLSTVATQAVAIGALALFPRASAARALAAALMALGAASYLCGAALILGGLARGGWTLASDWSNANCILHGALSITGLAAAASGFFAADALGRFWLAVLAVFALVEAVEVARLVLRVRAFGWRAGALAYDVSQWARNFTFGMFYAFTLALAQADPAPEALRRLVLAGGAYAVLFFLLIELALTLRAGGEGERRVEP